MSERRAFGLNFERHIPGTIELPNRPVRRGDKVRSLPERGKQPSSADRRVRRDDQMRGRAASTMPSPGVNGAHPTLRLGMTRSRWQ